MAKPFPTIGTQARNRNPNGKSALTIIPNLTLSVPFTDIPNDPSADTIYTFTVLRQGGNVGISDCDWAIVPAAGSPIPAAYFGGTYPNGHVHIISSQGQQSISFNVPTGVDPAADQFADIILSNFAGCRAGQITTYRVKAPGAVVVEDYVISVAMPVVALTRNPVTDQTYSVNLTRTRSDADYSNPSTVTVALAGTGSHPMTAADFTGGLLNQIVTFAAGEQTKTVQIVVKAGTAPVNDLTGLVALSAPSAGSHISTTGGSVAVAIPAAAGVLPVVSVAVPDVTWDRDPATPQNYTINVSRSGDTSGASSVLLTVAGTGANPMAAADFTGGLLSTTVNFATGETGPKASTAQVVAGAAPVNDLTGLVALSSPSGCTVSPTAGNVAVSIPKAVIVPDAIVALDVPITNLVRDDTSDHAYTVNVTRSGNTGIACSVQLAALGSGVTPFQASDFTGGLLNQLVSFTAGQTSKPFTILVKAGADPTTDLTGNISISAPSNCKIDPTAASVAVKIPAAVVSTPGILPPEYMDPNFTGMTPQGADCTSFAQVQTQCAALNNNPLCKTKYVKLAASYTDTVNRNFNYRGYVDPVTKLIYPLIVCGDPAKAKSRTTADINNRPHFNAGLSMNGATWMWFYGLAAEYPIVGGYQHDTTPAIDFDGSTDCFATRNWLDAPRCIHMNNPVRPRCGGNDVYGIWNGGSPQPWVTRIYIQCTGSKFSTQATPQKAYLYQNFIGNCRAPFEPADHTAAFYCGDGVSPELSEPVDYPNVPYDLNWRDSWFFNNLILSTTNYLIYNKNACNIWRNRVVSINNWTDTTGTGVPFHLIACRGGNWIGGTVKYNVVEARGGHSDFQSWNGIAEFNDWGGQPVNCFIHCHDPSKLPDGRFSKTLLAASHWRFRGNKNGAYQIGTARPDAGYKYYGDIVDTQWEGETGCTWNWESNYSFSVGGKTYVVNYNPSGTAITWDGSNKNSVRGTIQFPGDTFKTVAAVGALTRLPATTAVRQLTDATAGNGFTKAEKGIVSQEGLVWDGIGDGGNRGGADPYRLTSDNFTLHFPSDTMATDFPNCSLTWLAGGGFECKAGLGNAIDVGKHACLNLWMKNAPPHDAATFTFYFTRLDNLAAFDSDGVFAVFRERYKGLATYGADPNGWAKASWRTDPNYPTAGSDLIYRERGIGYRNSFANRALTAPSTMQFRLRTYNGTPLDLGTQIFDTTGFMADNLNGGSTFDFPLNVKCKVEVIRNGTSLIGKRTRTDNGVVQEWDWTDNLIGTAGRGVDGWCGFGFYLGMWGRVEPVPGVPFCQ